MSDRWAYVVIPLLVVALGWQVVLMAFQIVLPKPPEPRSHHRAPLAEESSATDAVAPFSTILHVFVDDDDRTSATLTGDGPVVVVVFPYIVERTPVPEVLVPMLVAGRRHSQGGSATETPSKEARP